MSKFTVAANDPRVLLDQARAAAGPERERIPSTVMANFLASGLMVFALWEQVPPATLWSWMAGMLAYQWIRVGCSRRFWRSHTTDAAGLMVWIWRFNALSVGSGLMWGMTGVWLFPTDSIIHQSMLAILLCAMAAGSIAANSALKVGMPGSAAAILMMLMGRMAWEGGRAHGTMVLMLLVYLVFILKWGKDLHQTVIESLQRRHQNHDLVDQLQLQTEAALEAKKQADKANQAKTRFLAAASHDLRQPMAALSLFAGVMGREQRPEKLQALAGHVSSSVSALEKLLNGLLDISKLDAHVTPVHIKNFGLQSILTRLLTDFSPEAQHKHLVLTIPASPAQLHTDPLLLEQVLRNLVGNAIRYTPSGRVEVIVKPMTSGWQLAVQYTGMGIATEHQEHVFDEFFKVGNAERDRNKGLGLGLSIVKRLSDLLNLHLELVSAPGQGTTVYLHVPAATHSATTDPVTQDLARCEPLPGVKVLVVDDEAPIREAMALLLGSWQCEVRTVESLEALVGMATAEPDQGWVPDCILSDYRLQNGALGTGVLHWAQSHWEAPIPALLMSGDTAPETLRTIEQSGHRLIHKPVDPTHLHGILTELLAATHTAAAAPRP